MTYCLLLFKFRMPRSYYTSPTRYGS